MKKLERFVPAYKRRRQFKEELARLTTPWTNRARAADERLNRIAEMCGLHRKEP